MNFASLLDVTVDFDRSHLLFPTIIALILGALFAAILLTRWRQIWTAIGSGPVWPLGIDQVRFFGSLGLTIVYFLAMEQIGLLLPNQGFGFYFASIPFVFLISVLYLHERTRRALTIAAINAVIAPTVVWYALSNLFNISLP